MRISLVVIVGLALPCASYANDKLAGGAFTMSFDSVANSRPRGPLMVLTVAKNKQLFLGKKAVPSGRVEALLRGNTRIQSTKQVALRIDGTVQYRLVLDLLVTIRQAGVDRVTFVRPMARRRVPLPGKLPR
jgi:biopolymer transport protein ExbD